MTVDMAERVRLVMLVDEELREALRVEASIQGKDMSDIVSELLRDHLADALELVRKRRANGGPERPSRRKPRED